MIKQKLVFLDELWDGNQGSDVTARVKFYLEEGWLIKQISFAAYGKDSTPGCLVLLELDERTKIA